MDRQDIHSELICHPGKEVPKHLALKFEQLLRHARLLRSTLLDNRGELGARAHPDIVSGVKFYPQAFLHVSIYLIDIAIALDLFSFSSEEIQLTLICRARWRHCEKALCEC